jgi:Methyltransferase domain
MKRLIRRRPAIALLMALICLAAGPIRAEEEVPFITTPDRVTLAMLELAGVQSSDRLLDLGSGDGRIVITAALRFGAQGTGVEIVPDLVQRSRAAAAAAKVTSRAQFLEQDLFKTDLSTATVITLYLLPEVNLQLHPKLLALEPGTRLVSHDWDMGDWPPDRTVTLDVPEKAIGREKRSSVHLWWVPAPLAGLWCGPDQQRLQVEQSFQSVRGRLSWDTTVTSVVGRISGKDIVLQGLNGELRLEWQKPGELRQLSASGAWTVKGRDRLWRSAGSLGRC